MFGTTHIVAVRRQMVNVLYNILDVNFIPIFISLL